MSDYGEKTCPLCAEEMDLTDQQLKPCKCGYQICVWCWHHIMDMAEKDQSEGRCPACRTPYDKEKIVGMTVDQERLASEGNMDRKKIQKSKPKSSDGRKPLTSVRVVQRNLVYIVGLPLNLADEDLLQRKEYFGQYGKVLKVSMSRTATGLIQQFPNNTCSVYITYGKEEEAIRCIQSVHGFILDGKALKACFGTTKYCHAWLRNVACNNQDCLYLHEVGSQEDSFTKDEIISAHTRVQQITGATNTMQYRSGSMLPPPLDAYTSDSSTGNPIAKVPSSTSVSAPKSSPPSGSSGKSTALPAAASWGARLTNQHSLATSALSNGSLDNQRSTSENGTLATSTVVTKAANGPVSSSNSLQKAPLKEEIQSLAEKSKPGVLKPLQQKIVLDPESKRTTSPNRDPSSNQISCLVESSYNSRVIDKPSAVENSLEHTSEIAEDVFDVGKLSADVAWMGITTNSRDETPGVPVVIGTHCDLGSITQSDNDVQNLEQCRKQSPTNTYAEADISLNGIHGSRPEWDWRSGLQSQIDVKEPLEVNDFSSFNNNRRGIAEAVSHSTSKFSSSISILDSNHLASRSFQNRETSCGMDSKTGSSFEIGSDRLHLPNGFSEKAMSNMEHSLFANEGRSNIQNTEDDIISNILDFDPWDESLTSQHNFAKLLGQSDHRASTLESSNLLKQHNDQSRFSFARHEESNSQAYDNRSYSIYGQLSRDQPLQEFGANRDMYQDKLGSQNGFASNYSGGYEQFATSPGLSSYKSPVARTQVSAPPGFSAPNRLPPPGFSSHQRGDLSSDIASGTRLLDSANLLRNAYHVPPPSGNLNAAGDIEFIDPAILAVGRGRLHNGMETADFDLRSGFSSQLNSFDNDARLQLLAQRSLAAQQVNGFHDPRNVNNFSSSFSDPYGISSRPTDQTQGTGLSPFTQLPRQASANPLLSNGHWDNKWNEPQSGNNLGITQLLRNERMGFNDNVYSGFEEPKFRRPGPGFCCSRSFKEKTRQPPVSIKRLFEAYSRNGKMSFDELLRFVSEVQGERHAGLDYVQDIFHSVKHHNVFHHHGLVHLNAFYRYLFSDTNSPLPMSGQVHHDMKAPLSHYFVYTGHNSYLTGNQVNSRSSVEPIVQALRKGVKVIELDLWPNPSGNAAEVRHGRTLTSHEDLQKCLTAIKDNAFHVSDYPVIITLEDHLPPKLQAQVAKMLTKTYRGMLFRRVSESFKHFPSPEELKGKILISTKPPKEYLESKTVHTTRTPTVKETSWNRVANKILEEYKDMESEAVGYRDLIAIHAANCKDPSKDCLSDDPEKPIRVSMDEQWLDTMVRTRGTDLVRFTQRNLVRIYPKGTRVDSSNYDPHVGWTHGAQMVAFNMQGHGKQLWIMQGMFRGNGGCGYVKKPRILLDEHTLFDPCKRFPIKTTLKVKIYTGEGWDLDFHHTHFDQYSPPDFFVKIGIAGVPRDTVSYRTETAVDQWFPIWGNDEFLFQLSVPELALLWFKVQDYDNDTQNDFAGQTCLPLPELKSGVRAVRLHDRTGKAYKNTRLLVSFALDPPYTFR